MNDPQTQATLEQILKRLEQIEEHTARPYPKVSAWLDTRPNSNHALYKALSDRALAQTVEIVEKGDEYFCYPNFQHHERRAFSEFLERTGYHAHWIAICGQRAACELHTAP